MEMLIFSGVVIAVVWAISSIGRESSGERAKKETWSTLSKIMDESFEHDAQHGKITSNKSGSWHYIKGKDKFGFIAISVTGKRIAEYIFKYSDILYLSIDVDGNKEVAITKSDGSLGRAVVGGVLFGPAGAIVGANMKRTGTIDTKNLHNILIYIGLKDITDISLSFTDISDDILAIRECYNFIAARHAIDSKIQEQAANDVQDDTKECPFCAETIKRAAIVCRYCKSDLPKAADTEATPCQQ